MLTLSMCLAMTETSEMLAGIVRQHGGADMIEARVLDLLLIPMPLFSKFARLLKQDAPSRIAGKWFSSLLVVFSRVFQKAV